ncbi:MAG: formylglycine-generating enzyme family protein [Candidatus Omnitrophica bacterium]|nr:formylglycine-generating enzyme family protein [Candidatus Omnitrophota bacterium]
MKKKICEQTYHGFRTRAQRTVNFFIFLFVSICFVPLMARANNLIIEGFEVDSIDTAANTITYVCDVSWDNSWRTTTNNDSVWVFLKYSTDAGVNWDHASMSLSGTDPMGFAPPVDFEVVVPNDEKGFFLQRTDLSSGSVSAEGVKFVWDYAQDGLSDDEATASNTINKIFGIEMVYIPEGSFSAGDSSSSSEYPFKQGSADSDPWYIQGEESITTANVVSDGYYYQSAGVTGENASGDVFLISTSFPKGYRSFYIMKYELTEGQWTSFFNSLSHAAKTNRDITGFQEGGKNSDSVVDRNTISWDHVDVKSIATTQRPDRPVTYISWTDLMAYADWAGLRPMTELEYEKAARGVDISAVPNEFAWGTASYNTAESSEIYPNGDEDGTEQIFDGAANINRNSLGWTSGDGRAGGIAVGQKGPVRAGIFAESSTNRETSGASFYGVMELSGNLYEMCVTVGRIEGRQYLGTHGDGRLSSVSGYEGNATNTDWPGINTSDSARGITGTLGSGYRGGDFQSVSSLHFQVSNRTLAVRDADTGGFQERYDATAGVYQGGRLVRTAP